MNKDRDTYEVSGIFSVRVYASNHREAQETAIRILKADGIEFLVVQIKKKGDCE